MCSPSIAAPVIVATFNNDRLGLCANVREFPDADGFEVAVVDAISGDVVVSRNFSNKEAAVQIAENLVDIRGQI